ncbi:MAG: glycosyltransferase family 39 protein [Bacteroidales bacterium]|nr:glycosyltransferase family 39 protein [Bacteroidales bacterium]
MNRNVVINILIVIVGTIVFTVGLGASRLFDWDEINFAESAREMLVTGDWFNVRINFESFWEKPPLFIWMQALSMKAFGVGEFAARFPNAVMGVCTLLLLFNIGRKRRDTRFGLLWMMMYGISLLPFFYFKSGIIDPWFNFFIFCGIYFFSRYADPEASPQRVRNVILSAGSLGLAVLTKGPVALLVFGLTFVVWLVVRRFRFSFRWRDVALWVAVFGLVGMSWFIILALTGHGQVINDFIQYQIRLFRTEDSFHGGFPLYHFVILLFGVAPASFFALGSFRRKVLAGVKDEGMADLFRWMMTSFWVVLILFSIVRTKIIHYSSFCYFPLSFLAAYAAEGMLEGRDRLRGYQRGLLIAISSLLGLVLVLFTLFDRVKEYLIPYVNDPFAVSCMEAESEWTGFEPLVGVFLIAMTVWFCVAFKRGPRLRHFAILGSGYVLFMFTTLTFAVKEVEKYSQDSAVEFFISKKGEDCYICPVFYKTFAHYFYSERKPENRIEDVNLLKSANLDKDCYFVIMDMPMFREQFAEEVGDAAEFLYRRSGYLFFVRRKSAAPVVNPEERQ